MDSSQHTIFGALIHENLSIETSTNLMMTTKELYQILLQKFNPLIERIKKYNHTEESKIGSFKQALIDGDIEVLEWLNRKWKYDLNHMDMSLFQETVLSTNDDDLSEREKELREDIAALDLALRATMKNSWDDEDNIFRIITEHGNLKTFKSVIEIFGFNIDDLKPYEQNIFVYLSGAGNIEFLSAVVEIFQLSNDSIPAYIEDAFINAARSGHLSTLKWMTETFNLTKDVIRANNYDPFFRATVHGDNDVIIWMIDKFQMTREDMRNHNFESFTSAVEDCQIDILNSMHELITAEDIQALYDDRFLRPNNAEVVAWLNHTYGLVLTIN